MLFSSEEANSIKPLIKFPFLPSNLQLNASQKEKIEGRNPTDLQAKTNEERCVNALLSTSHPIILNRHVICVADTRKAQSKVLLIEVI